MLLRDRFQTLTEAMAKLLADKSKEITVKW